MENIGFKLKEIRESLNLTRKEVAEKLKDYGIEMSDKTLYGYEVGRTSANADTFLALCDIYGINDILDTFGRKINPNENKIVLSPKESDAILYLRDLDEHSQDLVFTVIEKEHERSLKHLEEYTKKLYENLKKQ